MKRILGAAQISLIVVACTLIIVGASSAVHAESLDGKQLAFRVVSNSLSGTVWHDANRNGIIEADEQRLEGIRIVLAADTNGDGKNNYFNEDVTNSIGRYFFTAIPAGNYTISVDIFTLPPDINDPTFDADGINTPNRITTVVTSSSQTQHMDFGYAGGFTNPEEGSISGTVWHDANRDGVIDENEERLGGITVDLLDQAGFVVRTTTTDAEGFYSFSGPSIIGQFTVRVQNSDLPIELVDPTWDYDGIDTPHEAVVLVAPDTHVSGVDFGYAPQEAQFNVTRSGAKEFGNCKTIGFWKTNISKHLGNGRGTQVSKENLVSWLRALNNFYRPDPFVFTGTDNQVLQSALNIFDNHKGSNVVPKLLAQLLASQLNYVSGIYRMNDAGAHEALIKDAEDALNEVPLNIARLNALHQACDELNNLGNQAQNPNVVFGDTIFYTLTVTANLSTPKSIVVTDYLDEAVAFVSAENGGVYDMAEHKVTWSLNLPAGSSTTVLRYSVTVIASGGDLNYLLD